MSFSVLPAKLPGKKKYSLNRLSLSGDGTGNWDTADGVGTSENDEAEGTSEKESIGVGVGAGGPGSREGPVTTRKLTMAQTHAGPSISLHCTFKLSNADESALACEKQKAAVRSKCFIVIIMVNL